jgi:two-component system OmpR family response regulator
MERTASILVIEAHHDCRDVLVMTLEACEFAATAVANGGDALAALRDHTPDAVVIDNSLPDRNALDVVRVLRANRRFDATTIVLVGTWLPPADRTQAYAAGVDSVLLKPFVVDELVRKVTRQRPRSPHQA